MQEVEQPSNLKPGQVGRLKIKPSPRNPGAVKTIRDCTFEVSICRLCNLKLLIGKEFSKSIVLSQIGVKYDRFNLQCFREPLHKAFLRVLSRHLTVIELYPATRNQ